MIEIISRLYVLSLVFQVQVSPVIYGLGALQTRIYT